MTNITVDIEKLSTEQLKQLQAMFYYRLGNDIETQKLIRDRIAYNEDWIDKWPPEP